MFRLFILFVIFFLGGYLLLPEWAWGWIVMLFGVAFFICGGRAALRAPLLSASGCGGIVLGVLIFSFGLSCIVGEEAFEALLSLPLWVNAVGGAVVGTVAVLISGRYKR